MKLKNLLTLINVDKWSYKMICVKNQFSDFYIGRLDGKTNTQEYEELLDKNVIGLDFDTTAISGSKKVWIDIEITIEYEGED